MKSSPIGEVKIDSSKNNNTNRRESQKPLRRGSSLNSNTGQENKYQSRELLLFTLADPLTIETSSYIESCLPFKNSGSDTIDRDSRNIDDSSGEKDLYEEEYEEDDDDLTTTTNTNAAVENDTDDSYKYERYSFHKLDHYTDSSSRSNKVPQSSSSNEEDSVDESFSKSMSDEVLLDCFKKAIHYDAAIISING